MRVARNHSLAASKKESLAELTGRIRQAFLNARLLEPTIRFSLMGEGRVEGYSPIDRVLKRHPEMKRFETFSALIPGGSESRLLTNASSGEAAEYSTIQGIAAGVPRSYPFSAVIMHFHAPPFGEGLIGLPKFGNSLPGVLVTDNRWVHGRHRASVYTVAEADADDKKLTPNPEPVDAVIKACGKVRRTEQVPIRAPDGGIVGSIPPANAEAVKAIVGDYRARIKEAVELAGLPHNLPPAGEIRASECRGHGRSSQTGTRNRVQADGLWLPRRIGRVSFDSADFGKPDGRTVPGRRHMESCGLRDLSGPGRRI